MRVFLCQRCGAPVKSAGSLMCQVCWDKLTSDQRRSYHYWAEQLRIQLDLSPEELEQQRLLGLRKRQP